MALPPQVVEQLAREPVRTPGWSGRLLMFASTLFILGLVAYAGLAFGYERYLSGNIQELDREIKNASQQIPVGERANILAFYSQLTNLKGILDKHVTGSVFLSFLEDNTQGNVYYSRLVLNVANQEAGLVGVAKSVGDVTEQVKIFESQPQVSRVSLSNVANVGGGWQFEMNLKFASSFLSPAPAAPAPSATSTAPAPTPGSATTTAPNSTSTPTSTLR